MYLARRIIKRQTYYFLRESYLQGTQWLSRDLVSLGHDPRLFIHYPGGHSFLIDEKLEEELQRLTDDYDPDDLERLLLPFVRGDVRDRYQRFDRPRSLPPFSDEEKARVGQEVHLFDRRRIHYLRYAGLDQSRLYQMPAKMCRVLLNKSRDEIEQYFMGQEEVLSVGEWKEYVFVILDLPRYFDQSFVRAVPSALPQHEVDDLVVEELCHLQGDGSFWAGMATGESLDPYLIRYLLMYFDSGWPGRNLEDEYIRSFINEHRRHQEPPSQQVKMADGAKLFGVTWQELKEMGRRKLTRLYRQRAHELHPDKGGEAEEFSQLTEMYRRLLKRKKK